MFLSAFYASFGERAKSKAVFNWRALRGKKTLTDGGRRSAVDNLRGRVFTCSRCRDAIGLTAATISAERKAALMREALEAARL